LIFLDSDDTLLPYAARRVAAAFSATTAKVQFRLQTIDAKGQVLGHVAPKYPLHVDTATIRRELLRTGSSPCVQGSGNAYAKWLLERVKEDGGFMIPEGERFWMDALLEINAPFYGDVVTLREPLACYRIHDSNWSGHHCLSPARFVRMVEAFDLKLRYMTHRCRAWGIESVFVGIAGDPALEKEGRKVVALSHCGDAFANRVGHAHAVAEHD
jgi:hypothetical protein